MWHTNIKLNSRPEPVNGKFTLQITEVYTLDCREITPTYVKEVDWQDVIFVREIDETWRLCISENVTKAILKKGPSDILFHLVQGNTNV